MKHVLCAENFARFVCTCWCIWFYRNNKKLQKYPLELVNFAGDYLRRFQDAQQYFAAPRPPDSASSWSPPSGYTIKINVDASILSCINAAGIGIIARDVDGLILA